MKGIAMRRTGGLERDLTDAELRIGPENIGDLSAIMIRFSKESVL